MLYLYASVYFVCASSTNGARASEMLFVGVWVVNYSRQDKMGGGRASTCSLQSVTWQAVLAPSQHAGGVAWRAVRAALPPG